MKSVVCNLCGQDNYQVILPATIQFDERPDVRAFQCTSSGYGRHGQIVQCNHCHYMYVNPCWEEHELIQLYGEVEDETYVTERIGRRLTFEKHLTHLEQFTGPANGRSLLDVGAYIGVFVEVAQEHGWQATGVEPSKWAVEVAAQHNLQLILGTQDAPELHGRQFDLVTMWDVIEHVPNPAAELAKAYQLLKPGGYIAVHTMDVDSWLSKIMGARWPWYMSMHIQYFSQKTLQQMVKQTGFEVLWCGTRGRYLRVNYLASRMGGFNKVVGRVLGQAVNGLGLAAVALPVNFGDLFTVYARKPL